MVDPYQDRLEPTQGYLTKNPSQPVINAMAFNPSVSQLNWKEAQRQNDAENSYGLAEDQSAVTLVANPIAEKKDRKGKKKKKKIQNDDNEDRPELYREQLLSIDKLDLQPIQGTIVSIYQKLNPLQMTQLDTHTI